MFDRIRRIATSAALRALTGNSVPIAYEEANDTLVYKDTDGNVKTVATTDGVKDSTETLAALDTLTALDSGKLFFLNAAGGFAVTLPAVAAGLNFEFIVQTAPSGGSYTIVTASSANVIKGRVFSADLNAAADGDIETSGGDTITLVDAKAVAGDRVRLRCDGTNWFAEIFTSVFDAATITTAS